MPVDQLPDRDSYHAALRGHVAPPTEDSLKSRDWIATVLGVVMALGPLTVFAIFRGAGYSL